MEHIEAIITEKKRKISRLKTQTMAKKKTVPGGCGEIAGVWRGKVIVPQPMPPKALSLNQYLKDNPV